MRGKSMEHMGITERFVWIGVGLAGLFWILESSVHVFIFHNGGFIQQILPVQSHEIWMRLLVVVMLVVFGIYAQFIVIKRKGAEDALCRSEQELRLRNKILEIFFTIPDDQMYAEILQLVLKTSKSEFGTFGYFDKKGAFVIPSMTREIYWNKCNVPEKDIIFQEGAFGGIWGKAIKERKTIISNDGPFNTPEGHIIIKNTMIVPIIHQDRLISAIHIANKATYYDDRDRALLETIANHVAPVLHARLQRDRQDDELKKAEEALKEREATLKSILDAAPIGMGVVENRVIKFVNLTMCNMTGYFSEELVGKSSRIVYESDEEFDRVGRKKYKQIKVEGVGAIETRFKCKDDSIIDVWLSSSAIDPSDLSRGVAFTALDITERKRAEKVLRESEERYRNLYENAPNAYFSISVADGSILRCNQAAMRLLGYDEETLIGMNVFDLYDNTPDGKSKAQEVFKNIKTDKFLRDVELQMKHKDGHPVWINLSVDPMKDESGKVMETRSMATDISHRKQAEDALRQERDKAQQYLDIAGVMFIALNSDGNITLINRKGCEVLATKPEYAIGKNWFDHFLPETVKEDVSNIFHKLMHGQIVHSEYFENPIMTSTGEEKIIAWHNTILKDEAGRIIGTLSSGEDITERKRAEEALCESEEKLRTFMDSVTDFFAVTDKNENLIYINRSMAKNLGYSKEEMIGMHITEIIDEGSMVKFKPELRQLIEEGNLGIETTWLTKDGRKIHGDLKVNSIYDAQGNYLGSRGVFRDITERKRAEETLRESEEKYSQLFSTIPDAGMIFDADTKSFIDVNESALSFYGYSREEFLNLRQPDITAEKEASASSIRLLQSGELSNIPLRYHKKKDGTIFPVEISASTFHIGGRNVICGLVRDISERKRVEEELTKSSKQLRHLSTYLQSVIEVERTNIAREVHDDLGQALTALKMDLHWLANRLPRDQQLLLNKTKSMSTLIDLTVQSVQRISSELRPGLLDDLGLSAAIEWQADEFENRTGIKCKVEVDPEEIVLDRDRSTAIFRIFQESLTNIARHANATMVYVSLKEESHTVGIKVSDNGEGITKKKISDPTSFGLIGMRERVHPFGGYLSITGTPKKGTTVTVRIPLDKREKLDDKGIHRG